MQLLETILEVASGTTIKEETVGEILDRLERARQEVHPAPTVEGA
jgi:hypothetical protein